MGVTVDQDQCMGCGNCLPHCPQHLLAMSAPEELNARGVRYVVLTDASACVSCGRCELMCTAAALHVPGADNGHDLLDKAHTPPHSGCSLGSLAKALADAIHRLGVEDRVVLFKRRAADVNLLVESHDYDDDAYFPDGLAYKREHPDKLVVIIANSPKEASTHLVEERLGKLAGESVTIINTLDWFEADEQITRLTGGGSLVLEDVARRGHASYAARSLVRTPQGVTALSHQIEQAVRNQMDGQSFAVVQMVFPCYYRLFGRPQRLMSAEEVGRVGNWFDEAVAPSYPAGVLAG